MLTCGKKLLILGEKNNWNAIFCLKNCICGQKLVFHRHKFVLLLIYDPKNTNKMPISDHKLLN